MVNAKKPPPHHHDMQGKTILAFRRIVQKKRYVWKRLRKTVAKAPAPATSQRAQARLTALQARESAGACALWYFDASGFCLEPCIPYAWQPIGTTLELPQSSHNQRLNV